MGNILQYGYLICFIFFTAQSVSARTWTVSPDNPQQTLAATFEKISDGDTIFIKPGTYREGALFLRKAATIIGESYPRLDGEDKHEILFVEHDDVTIKGVLFENSGSSNFNDIAALKINKSKNILIEDCIFENNFFGIHTMNSSDITYLNNRLHDKKIKKKPSANGIHIWKTERVHVENNTVIGHRDGIYLEFVKNSHIENNQSIQNSRYGMHFMFSHDNLFKHNTFKDNGAGVAVMYSKRVEMTQNIFTQSWGNAAYGLLLKEIDDSKITNNIFSDNTIGIYGDGANRVYMKGNDFLRNGWALKINASSSEAMIIQNNFIANTFDFATNGNLKVKSLDENYWDKYEGYDLDRDGLGDVPYRPITFYSLIIERNQGTLMLFRSFFVKLMDRAESIFPSLTPENIKDNQPRMRKIKTSDL